MDSQDKELLRQASSLMKQQDFAGAISLLKNTSSENELLLGLLSAAYAEVGLVAEAEATLDRLVLLHPENHLALFQLGMFKYQRGLSDEAFALWKPLANQPLDLAAAFALAQAHYEQGLIEDAYNYVQSLKSRMPADHAAMGRLQALEYNVLEVARANGLDI